jgi:uncharacterized SAM-binding protein YcdF (DUF218 family)
MGSGPLPEALLRNLQSQYATPQVPVWQPRSVIIVLGGGAQGVPGPGTVEVPLTAYGRVFRGLQLYLECKHAGKVCVVLISGGDPVQIGVSEAQVYAAALESAGVDRADLAIEGRSLNTWQNAQYCADWLAAHPQDLVVLVTSGFHLRRSALYFSHFGIRATAVRADYVTISGSLVPRSYNFLLMDLALHEYAGLWRYRIYNLLGWNITAAAPRGL